METKASCFLSRKNSRVCFFFNYKFMLVLHDRNGLHKHFGGAGWVEEAGQLTDGRACGCKEARQNSCGRKEKRKQNQSDTVRANKGLNLD